MLFTFHEFVFSITIDIQLYPFTKDIILFFLSVLRRFVVCFGEHSMAAEKNVYSVLGWDVL